MIPYIKMQNTMPDAFHYIVGMQPDPPKKRKRFTPEEDKQLTYLVHEYGNNWDVIASHISGRNKRQVKERWCSYLSPNLIALPFTPSEDKLLEEKINELGTKWVSLLKFFPNRTDVALKNRWNMIKRQRMNGGKHQNRKRMTPQSSGPAPVISNKDDISISNYVSDNELDNIEAEIIKPDVDVFQSLCDETETSYFW